MSEFDGVVDVQEPVAPVEPTPAPLEPGGVRFEQIYGKMKEYEKQIQQFKDFGDPDGVKTKLSKLEQYEKAIEEYRKKEAMSPDEKTEAQRQLAIQKELYKVMPSLKNLDRLEALEQKLAEYEGKATESATTATLEKMSVKFAEQLKAAKIDTKYQGKIEDYIVSQMTQQELQEFVKGNYEIAERIFASELKDGVLANLRTRPGLPTPPVRNTPGGTPPKGQQNAKTMKEAEEEAWARLTSE